jgi:hypothetical protein
VRERRRFRQVREALPTAATAHGEDDCRNGSGAQEHVRGPGRRMEEIPGLEPPFLALDDQQALAGE